MVKSRGDKLHCALRSRENHVEYVRDERRLNLCNKLEQEEEEEEDFKLYTTNLHRDLKENTVTVVKNRRSIITKKKHETDYYTKYEQGKENNENLQDLTSITPPTSPVVSDMRKPRRKTLSKITTKTSLSPLKDDQKKTPSKPKASEEQTKVSSPESSSLPSDLVAQILQDIYEDVEKDDRQMYRFDTQTAKEQTQCDRSEFLDELSTQEFRRMLTYGEVSVASITETVLPLLQLEEDDIFYDLGCGTGKIVVQAALETPCRIAKGIELMQNRVIEGAKALQILNEEFPELVEEKNIVIVQGDICKPPQEAPMMDATVVFINNVCFGPELMLKVMDMLSQMKNLRRVVTLRKICERHRDQKCFRAGNPCMEYVHPPFEAEIHVSWAHKTSVYLYERLAAFEANCQ